MEFRQIRYFLAVCDHMNFTRAAESCAVSQPALTVAIQKLEQELGGPLFLRDGRQISLTPLGRVMRTHLAKVDETRRAAHGAAEEVVQSEMEHVELGVMCTIGPTVLEPALAAWRQQNPGVELVIHDVWGARAQDLLLSGALDCALIARQAPLPDRFETQTLMSETFELACAADHPLAAAERISLQDIHGVRYLDRLRCEFRETVFDMAKERGLEPEVVIRSEREDWIQTLVASGQGITMLPRSSVIVDGIQTRPVDDLPVNRTIDVAVVRGRPLRNVVARFVAFLAEFYATDEAESA